jgi:hypothetical protein
VFIWGNIGSLLLKRRRGSERCLRRRATVINAADLQPPERSLAVHKMFSLFFGEIRRKFLDLEGISVFWQTDIINAG